MFPVSLSQALCCWGQKWVSDPSGVRSRVRVVFATAVLFHYIESETRFLSKVTVKHPFDLGGQEPLKGRGCALALPRCAEDVCKVKCAHRPCSNLPSG